MKTTQKNLILLAIIIVVLVVIVAGTLYSKKSPSLSYSETSSGEIAGWKQYQNNEFGFQFNYPSEWRTESVTNRRPEYVIFTDASNQEVLRLWTQISHDISPGTTIQEDTINVASSSLTIKRKLTKDGANNPPLYYARATWAKGNDYSKSGELIMPIKNPQSNTQSSEPNAELKTFDKILSSLKSTHLGETEVITALIENWKAIAPAILPNYPPAKKAFYGYPLAIQFIGNNKIFVSYQDDFNPFLAVLSYTDSGKFSFVEQQVLASGVASKWDRWVSKYSNPSSDLNYYEFKSTRTGDVVYPSDWVKISSKVNEFK